MNIFKRLANWFHGKEKKTFVSALENEVLNDYNIGWNLTVLKLEEAEREDSVANYVDFVRNEVEKHKNVPIFWRSSYDCVGEYVKNGEIPAYLD